MSVLSRLRLAKPRPPLAAPTKTFLRVWGGQAVSVVGSGLTGFAAGVWVYERTGSVTSFALTVFAATIPSLLIMPFQGPLVDRWDRRKTMLLADGGQGLTTLVLLILLLAGRLEVWHVWLAVGLGGILGAGHTLAWTASTTLLVRPAQLGRANGLLQLGPSFAHVLSPVLAGGLFAAGGLWSVLVLDLATFVVALITLWGVELPAPRRSPAADRAGFLAEVLQGWRFILDRPGLVRLLLLFATVNLGVGTAATLTTPLLLSFTSVQAVGLVTSISGSGLLVGSLLLTAWGGPERRIHGVLGFGLLAATCLMLASLHPSAVLVAAAGFGWMLAAPLVNGCSQALWQLKTPPHLQGRVFAVRVTVARSTAPLAYLAAGPLVDRVLQPMLEPEGLLAPTLGTLVGVGAGRGTAALLLLAGAVAALSMAAGYLSPRLRHLESEVPDALDEVRVVSPPAAASAPRVLTQSGVQD